jgi:hypothetical protein
MDPELEGVVLGTILHDGEPAYTQVASLLAPEDFTVEKHRLIFAAMRRIGAEVNPGADAVAQALLEADKLASVDGLGGLMDLHAKAIPGINLENFATALRQKSNSRRAVRLAGKLSEDLQLHGLNGNAPEIAAAAQELITLSEGVQDRAARVISSVEDVPPVGESTEPIDFIRKPELPKGAVIGLTGDSGSGKSTIATAWLRDAMRNGVPGLILDRESPRSIAIDRMERLGIVDSPLLRWWGGWAGDVPSPTCQTIRSWVQACDVKPLIIVDSLIAFLEADENDAAQMRRFMNGLRKLADIGATAIVVHHDGKAETARDFRGSSDFKASLDQAFHVSNLGSDGKLDRLNLRCFKSRYGFSGSLVYHYAGGRMVPNQSIDAPMKSMAEQLTEILRQNPGLTGEKFEKLAVSKGSTRQCARDFLANGVLAGTVHMERSANVHRYHLETENE